MFSKGESMNITIFFKRVLFCFVVATAYKAQAAENDCCAVNLVQPFTFSSSLIRDFDVNTPGCIPAVTINTIGSLTYDSNCNLATIAEVTPSYIPLVVRSITQATCNAEVVIGLDQNLHVYPVANCVLGAEAQTIPYANQIGAMKTNNTCLAYVSAPPAGGPSITTYSITNCLLTVATSNLSLIPFLGASVFPRDLAFSPAASSCNFVVVPASLTSPVSPSFVVIPVNSDCTLGTPVPYNFGFGTPFAVALSPNGNNMAISYLNGNNPTIEIFSIAYGINCAITFTPIQSIAIPTGANFVEYSPDGSCLLATIFSGSIIYPINNQGLADTVNTHALPSGLVEAHYTPACNFLVTLTVNSNQLLVYDRQAPIITVTTQSPVVICQGDTLSLETSVTNDTGFTLQWFKGNVAVVGATMETLTINNAQPSDSGTYTLQATNGTCTVVSSPIEVTVKPLPTPTITSDKTNYCIGDTITLTASPTNGSSYIWNTPARGIMNTGASNVLILPNAQPADAGNYTVSVTVNGCTGTTTVSNLFTVSPCAPKLALVLCCPSRLSCNGQATFKVDIRNSGAFNANNVVVNITLPDCLTFVGAQAPGWTIMNAGQVITATLPVLSANALSSFEIIVQANNCKGKITTQASATADGVVTSTTATCTTCIK